MNLILTDYMRKFVTFDIRYKIEWMTFVASVVKP